MKLLLTVVLAITILVVTFFAGGVFTIMGLQNFYILDQSEWECLHVDHSDNTNESDCNLILRKSQVPLDQI